MPLSPAADRTHLHTRRIDIEGFERADGLYDIEAHLVDTKSYSFRNTDRGQVEPGVPLHEMWARMTIDGEMLITAFEAATDYSPYTICPKAAPNFARLAGLRVGRGFLKQAAERIGGVHGCTHLRELLGQMGTVAFQTMYNKRARRQSAPNTETVAERSPQPQGKARLPILGTCLAYAPDSPVVKRDFPEHYTGN